MTSGAHTIDENANLKAQIDSEGPGLSFGYFEILLACIVIEIIASFWENSLLLGKFDLFWPPVTSILTSSKNDPYVFCSTLHGLSNAVYRFSMRCVVLEISGGGAEINPPPAGSRLVQTPAGARVNPGPQLWGGGGNPRWLFLAACHTVWGGADFLNSCISVLQIDGKIQASMAFG